MGRYADQTELCSRSAIFDRGWNGSAARRSRRSATSRRTRFSHTSGLVGLTIVRGWGRSAVVVKDCDQHPRQDERAASRRCDYDKLVQPESPASLDVRMTSDLEYALSISVARSGGRFVCRLPAGRVSPPCSGSEHLSRFDGGLDVRVIARWPGLRGPTTSRPRSPTPLRRLVGDLGADDRAEVDRGWGVDFHAVPR